ncbi:Pnap_2097 family protein [Novosphingobium sp. SG707]|uniref:Pnap_2097 family protein n=1 Tax=Novosphingobium sp. SG707 TaxID=2586996 RepID=UPI001446C454|nr:Pnap_2097 family protein [Novosphingobium sp. SG707]NKJ01627.1 putative biosynthetic protein (TIGR04099 family) [Novosphingobium sp. SG707]
MAGAFADLAQAPAAARLEWPSFEPVRAGMPQLCRAGLSENWLLKACGHRHWLALAAAHGMETPDFRGAKGERLYPAFVAVDVAGRGAGLGSVGENDMLDFALRLERIGRTRFRSRIKVFANTRPVATVEMTSIFVHRAVPGMNRSATRAMVALPCGLLPAQGLKEPPFRPDGWEAMLGFTRGERAELARLVLDPSPHEDFNRAEFLYFSAFQAMLDRAEWSWFRQPAPLFVTEGRRIFYLGNAELGDRIIMVLCGTNIHDKGRDHWVEMRRESDDKLIAVAFSLRRPGIAR